MAGPDSDFRSLARVTTILTTFDDERPALTISEIAQHTRLPRSTVHRQVMGLVQLGFLSRDAETDRYRLGRLLIRLGAIALGQLSLRRAARPVMEDLAARTGEVVFLAVLDECTALYVEKVEGHHSLRMAEDVGRRTWLHATATGMTLLASLPDEQVRRIVGQAGMPRFTPRTITAVEPLLAHLARARRDGYVVDDGFREIGLAGIAAPIRDATGAVAAALAVAGPAVRLLPSRQPDLAPVVVDAADEVSAALGYRSNGGLLSVEPTSTNEEGRR